MTEDNKRENIALLLAEAAQALSDARLLLAAGRHKSAISRAYYAALDFARALLLSEGVEVKTHSGVQQMIYQRFVRAGLLSPVTARILQQLEADRLQADYVAAAVYTEETAAQAVEAADSYGAAVRDALGRVGYP